jgi:cell division septation protein DedD
MLRSSESETEILLGNKQLLGIFFVVAILLGIAFYGGYMVGRASTGKTATVTTNSSSATPAASPAQNPNGSGGETHSFPVDSASGGDSTPAPSANPQSEEPPLGSPKRTAPQSAANDSETFTPQTGQEFLQVAAVGRDEAEAVADVLHKKGFRAHAIPKPGNTKIYRVLIGPIRDAGDLSSTRDALRRTGFREVIVQRY